MPDFLIIFGCFQRKFYTEKTFLFKISCLFPVNAGISSRYLVETFWQDVQNCISIVQRSMIPGKNCFLKMLTFSQIRIWSICCLKVLWQLFASLEKISIQVSTETFWRNNLFFDRYQIFSFTDFNRCNFEHSKETNLTVFSIRHSTYPEERMDEIFFLQRSRIVLPFLDFEWKVSWISAGKLCNSCPNCSWVYRLRFPAFFFANCAIFSCHFCILIDLASFSAESS